MLGSKLTGPGGSAAGGAGFKRFIGHLQKLTREVPDPGVAAPDGPPGHAGPSERAVYRLAGDASARDQRACLAVILAPPARGGVTRRAETGAPAPPATPGRGRRTQGFGRVPGSVGRPPPDSTRPAQPARPRRHG
jgi:hypothetical protein